LIPKLVFRADGSNKIGLGHLYRCVALKQMLEDSFDISFATFKPDIKVIEFIRSFKLKLIHLNKQTDLSFIDDFQIIVLDGYWYNDEYVKQIRKLRKIIVQIDDLPKSNYYADLIINHALGVNYSNSNFQHKCKLLLGPKYALLRREFLNLTSNKIKYTKPKILTINFGGSDPNNYTNKLVKVLNLIKNSEIKSINLLVGSAYKQTSKLQKTISKNKNIKYSIYSNLTGNQVKKLLHSTSLFICPSSTIVYEACAIGVPTIAFFTANNQQKMYEGLVSYGAVREGGNIAQQDENQLSTSLLELLNNYNSIVQCIPIQNKLIDGQSGKRIKDEMLTLCN